MVKKQLKFTSSWDDGHLMDYKIMELLTKYKLPGTFYIPTNSGLTYDEIRKYVMADFVEIGGHTSNHPADMKLLNAVDLFNEINDNKAFLEDATMQQITKFCYPRGRYDERTIEVLKQVGFTHARTTVVLETAPAENNYRTHTTIHVYQRKEYGDVDWKAKAAQMVEVAARTDGIFHIWGHSWEIERDKNWNKLDKFFEWLVENYEIIKV